jgi:cytochrome c oxidase assembly protein subunit 15
MTQHLPYSITDSITDFTPSSPSPNSYQTPATIWIRRALWTLAGVTFFLMALGSATRVMNAGLSCPDWPLCYGEVIPAAQMNLQVFLEWFHRLVASSVGFITLSLTIGCWWQKRQVPQWLPWGMSGALLLVIAQGILGGLTVTQLLQFEIVTAHLGTGLFFFATLLTLALSLQPVAPQSSAGANPSPTHNLAIWGTTATALLFGQSILGALVASRWALHQCFAGGELCTVMNSHLLGIAPVTLSIVAMIFVTKRTAGVSPWLKRLAHSSGILLVCQLIIGYSTYRLRLQVEPLTVAHQATGAALLGVLVCYTVITWQMRRVANQTTPQNLS